MRLLVLHKIPFHKIQYDRAIDHDVHDVTYVGTKGALASIPATLRCTRLERPGTSPAWMEVLAALDPRAEARSFDRVISLSEYELLDAARVREALGVPGARFDEVERVRNKVRMKEAIVAAGIRVPRFEPLDRALAGASAAWTGRTVLKPVDGASSENVVTFDTREAALAAVRDGATKGTVEDASRWQIEEFTRGPIFHVDGLVDGDRLVASVTSRYVGTCLGYAEGRPLGSVQVASDPAIDAWAASCLRALSIRQGCFHLEAFDTPEGPVFLEVAARAGGAEVVRTFELATGLFMHAAALSLFLQGDSKALRTLPPPAPRSKRTFGWFVFPGHHLDGDRCRIEGAEPFRIHPSIVQWNELPPDARLPKTITYQSVEAPVAGIVGGDGAEELEALLRRMFAEIRVVPIRDRGVSLAT